MVSTRRSLYDSDLVAWCDRTADLLRQERWAEIDAETVAEELEALGRSERRALRSFLKVLLMHHLKWEYQPEKRTRSWEASIRNSRQEIRELFQDSPSLRRHFEESFEGCYQVARDDAAFETGLEIERFPFVCPEDLRAIVEQETGYVL